MLTSLSCLSETCKFSIEQKSKSSLDQSNRQDVAETKKENKCIGEFHWFGIKKNRSFTSFMIVNVAVP